MTNLESSSPHTIKAYRLDLSQAISFSKPTHEGPGFEKSLLDMARAAQVNWGRLSLASRNRKAASLKSFFKWAFTEGYIQAPLADQIICPKVPKKLPNYLSVDEALSLIQSLEPKKTPDKCLGRDKALILLLYGGGLRVSEACALKWRDVNLDRGTLKITGKGQKQRLVAVPDRTAHALRALPRIGEYIWGTEALSPRLAFEVVRKRGAQAGIIHPLNPHALRHSFATHLLSGGANLRTLQELLGHQSLTATEKYTHLGVDQLARTLEAHHPLGRKG